MGFVVPRDATNWQGQGQVATGSTVSVPAMRAGDLLFVVMGAAATTTFSIGGLTNATTVLESNISMNSVAVGGTGTMWCGYVLIDQADVAAHTFTVNATGGSNVGYAFTLVRSSVLAGGSLTVQKNTAAFFTTNAATVACPQNAPLHPHDLRMLLLININNPNATLYTLAEAKTVENPAAAQTYTIPVGAGGTSSLDVGMIINPGIVSSLDTASVNLTESGATSAPKWYVRPLIVSEGASDAAPPAVGADDDTLVCPFTVLAVGMDHDIGIIGADITGRGGGSGISVY